MISNADAYDPTRWHDFAAGVAGASAALIGLVFVAVSIHLHAVLGDPIHQRRAESAFVSLLVVLAAALLLLLPGLSRNVYGVVCVLIALIMLVRSGRSALLLRVRAASREPWLTWAIAVIAALVLLVGGAGLMAQRAGGLYLVAGALMLTAARAMVIVWQLFVSLSKEEALDERPIE